MNKLNDILHELGISKVKLAKFLGVSRQMIYNYLEMDDINKWPKDKKVLLLNLLGIKSVDEIENIKVDTDYIMDVETRINSLFDSNSASSINDGNSLLNGMGKNQKELLKNVIEALKERLDGDDEDSEEGYYTVKYLYSYQALITNINYLSDKRPSKCTAKFRYRQPDIDVNVVYGENAIKVFYPQGVKAVTPGQACVLYLNDECILGGIIEEIYDENNNKISYI